MPAHTFMPDTQQGATIAFSGLATFVCAAQSIPATESPVPVIDNTHLGTEDQRTRMPGDLEYPKTFTVKFQNDGMSAKPVKKSIYTVTITAPLPAGASTAEKWAGSCIVEDVKSPAFEAGANALQMIDIVLQPDGGWSYGGSKWTHTDAA